MEKQAQLTPEQALKILSEATASVNGSRNQHLLMLEALRILTAAIQPQKNNEGVKE